MKKIALLIVVSLVLSQPLQAQTKWLLDKNHSNIRFTAVHYVITEIEGEFKEFDGSVTSESEYFEGAEVEFTAKVASISTDNERRDNHLKSDEFFNAEKYPEVKYNGSITLERGKKAGFKITGVIDRFEYGLKYNRVIETGGLAVSREIQIICNIELNESTGT